MDAEARDRLRTMLEESHAIRADSLLLRRISLLERAALVEARIAAVATSPYAAGLLPRRDHATQPPPDPTPPSPEPVEGTA